MFVKIFTNLPTLPTELIGTHRWSNIFNLNLNHELAIDTFQCNTCGRWMSANKMNLKKSVGACRSV